MNFGEMKSMVRFFLRGKSLTAVLAKPPYPS